MLNSQKLTVWNTHLQALNAAIETMPVDGDYPRKSTIEQICDCLQAFAQRQFDFFMRGFSDDSGDNLTLDPSDVFPVDSVFHATLMQVAYDMDVVRRGAAPRMSGSEEMVKALVVGDYLAQRAVDPAINHGFVEDTAVLTYFQKSANIRVIPYAPLALIALPDSATHMSRAHLATAHEAGHYVFRHGHVTPSQSLVSKLRQAVATEPLWLKRWLEEIFADVYGCLVAGPAAALSFQDLLLDDPLFIFTGDDGEHPVALLRPYIYSKVLRMMGFAHAPDKLDDRWETWLAQRGNPTAFVPHGYGDGAAVSLADARTQVEGAVEKIVNVLDPIFQEHKADHNRCWTQDVAADADLMVAEDANQPSGPLYGQFHTYVSNVPTTIHGEFPELKESPTDPSQVGVAKGDVFADTRTKGTTGLWLDTITASSSTPVEYPPAVWEQVLSADGWATKGPEGNWP